MGLAVDGAASNDGSNLLEELRVCYLLHRLQSSQSAPTGYDILKLATRGSAACWAGTTSAAWPPAWPADCFLISLDRIELAGAQFDPLSLLGTVGLKGPVDYTIVNGMAVVQNGELVTADEGELACPGQCGGVPLPGPLLSPRPEAGRFFSARPPFFVQFGACISASQE